MCLSVPTLIGLPFLLAGALKFSYDLLLWRSFRAVQPAEDRPDVAVRRGAVDARSNNGY
jgi:hypothetical protein